MRWPVGEVAADSLALIEGLPGGPGGAGIPIVEDDVVMDVIANRLDALPSRAVWENRFQAASDSRSVSQ